MDKLFKVNILRAIFYQIKKQKRRFCKMLVKELNKLLYFFISLEQCAFHDKILM